MTIADRLKPYQVAHSLIHRLELYDVSRPASQFRAASWNTLVFWAMLLDGDDEGIAICEPPPPLKYPEYGFVGGGPMYEP